jgi:hypothetical protein
MTFGDFFPVADRLESVRRQLIPGYVFYLHCPFTVPKPKPKYLLLVCAEPLIFLVINSEQRDLVKSNERWAAVQIELLVSEYPFLEYDSWVDCTYCTEPREMTRENVEQQLLADTSRIKEPRLANEKMEEVMNAVADSPGLLPQDKTLIMTALSALY